MMGFDKILKIEKRLCPCCMEEHEVKTVLVTEKTIFKNVKVKYQAIYQYCENADTLYENEEQMIENYLCIKSTYKEIKRK